MLKNVWMILGCIAFGGWNILNGSTDRKTNINGIIADRKGDSNIELKFCADGINLDTPFMIGSISKQFTGVLALKYLGPVFETDITTLLTEDEFKSLIDALSEPVRSFLWPQLQWNHLVGVTVKDLLLHRSKINYCTGEPLSGFQYQNLNYALLGRIFEAQTGESYEELIHKLFQKVGMTSTFLHSDFSERELFCRLGESLRMLNRDPETMKMNVITKAENAAGGIVSTGWDLLNWNKFLAENGYYERLTKFAEDDGSGRRYGFGILTNAQKSFFAHNGGVPVDGVCYLSFLLYDLAAKFSVVGLRVLDQSPEEDFHRSLWSAISSETKLEKGEVGL